MKLYLNIGMNISPVQWPLGAALKRTNSASECRRMVRVILGNFMDWRGDEVVHPLPQDYVLGEDTYVCELDWQATMSEVPQAIRLLSLVLNQDCIAVRDENGNGMLLGPKPWGQFDPAKFLMPSWVV